MSDKFPMKSVSEALEDSLRGSPGLLKRNSATVAAARSLALLIDDQQVLVSEGGKFDNTVFPTFLKFCEALGLTVEKKTDAKKPAEPRKPASKMDKFKGLKVV